MFVKDDKKSVKAKLDEVGKSVNASLSFASIDLFLLGK
jgi:elongation factor Ts